MADYGNCDENPPGFDDFCCFGDFSDIVVSVVEPDCPLCHMAFPIKYVTEIFTFVLPH